MSQIDVLPDDMLLEIFYFYVDTRPSPGGITSAKRKAAIEAWKLLVHVCRRWRSLVFGSPRRLNLRLYCTSKTPIRDTLDVWPAFPLVVDSIMMDAPPDADNIIPLLQQSNRICQINLNIVGRHPKAVLAALQVPFPELTDLRVWSVSLSASTDPQPIPDSFLDGSAPRLQSFQLSGTPFPGLPKLLLSATHLVELRLIRIPHSGYISPEVVVAITSVLSGLRILSLDFQSYQSRPINGRESRSLHLQKRSILPALDTFHFGGASEYLEDFVGRIDTPQLDEMHITFFDRITLDYSLLAQFIDRLPTLRECNEAHVQFTDHIASVALQSQSRTITIGIACTGREPNRQLSSVAQVCNTPLLLSAVEDLYIVHRLVWKNDATIKNTHWLQVLFPFSGVKRLYLCEEYAPGIAAALKGLVGARIAEVLPSLQKISVERLEPSGPFRENIALFVAARLHCDHPIAISPWRKDSGTTRHRG